MISIRSSVEALDSQEAQKAAILEGYLSALRSAGEYAVRVDDTLTGAFSRVMQNLVEALREASDLPDYESIKRSVRGRMRQYGEQAGEVVARLREDLAAASAAMGSFAGSLTAGGADHEARVRSEVARLADLALKDNLLEIRQGIRETAANILEGYEEMRRGHLILIAQFQDEIQALHREIGSERRMSYTDPVSRAWNRRKLDERIGELAGRGEPHCVLLAWLRNLSRLRKQHPPDVIEQLLKAAAARLSGILEEAGTVGRWGDEEFAAVLEVDASAAAVFARKAGSALEGDYSVQSDGRSVVVKLEVTAGILDRK